MDRWPLQAKIFVVEKFANLQSITAVQRAFRAEFGDRGRGDAPSRLTIRRWIRKWQDQGSVRNKKGMGRRRSVRNAENIERVRNAFEHSPKRSAKRHSLTLNISERSLRRILHLDLKFHPYKMQIVQELNARQKENRLQCCQNILNAIQINPHLPNQLLMSDEANFYLSGFVNKQNYRYWSDRNPREVHEKPLHSPKVIVWCAIGSMGIIGPYFFEDVNGRSVTVNSERYVEMLINFLQPELHRRGIENVYFQQDGATAHTARRSLETLRNMFPGRLISRFGDIPWAACSPDLTAADNFPWGCLKERVFSVRINNLNELKNRITAQIEAIPEGMLRRVMAIFPQRLQACIAENGGHLKDCIFKS